MSLAQLHFASAPPGSDGTGPRFTAVSPGVPDALLQEAEQLLAYEPPHDAPPHPTPAELSAFPGAFSHSVLADGSRLLARTVCTGTEPGQDRATFHAHAVHLPADAALSAGPPPISSWDSPQWAVGTPVGGAPTPLRRPPESRSFDRRELVAFAASRSPWLAGFFAALRPSAGEPAAPQLVLVERDSADVARWIALASTVLPPEDAHRLTFTTYTRHPRLARQQIIGVPPADARGLTGQEHRYRVLDCTVGLPAPPFAPATPAPPTAPVADAWAEIAVHVWLGRAPELFAEAATLPGGRFAPGPLAVAALCSGISPGTNGRTAAAIWVSEHANTLDGERLHRVVDALISAAEDRTPAETAALAHLFTALDGRAPATTTAPLGVLVLTEAVRAPGSGPGLSDLRLSSLPDDLRQRLAAELAPELRVGIEGFTGTADAADRTDGADPEPDPEPDTKSDTSRPVELLRLAEQLGVDCTDLLPGLTRRLSRALISDPEAACTPAVRAALDEHFDLRTLLLGELDALAAGDPPAAVRLLGRTALSVTGVQSLPHLRMCARAADSSSPDADRVAALRSLLRACGVSPFADPLVLRTAVRLVWDGATPTPGEARTMLADTGSDAHRTADTWPALVHAALEGPGDSPDSPDLAHDLLRSFPGELEPRVRGALLLLEFAGDLRDGRAAAGWTDRALALRAGAEPVEPGVLAQVFGTVARHLLSEQRPEGELYALVHSGDPDLTAAYLAVAHEDGIRDRLRTVPAFLADCFTTWTALPGANETWDRTRTTLLDKVLRPVVRTLPAEDIAAVERCLERTGSRKADEFRAWNRPGALSRLGLRFGGRGRGRAAAVVEQPLPAPEGADATQGFPAAEGFPASGGAGADTTEQPRPDGHRA
ncbi:GTPase-associated protein 1-related protein [Streptomyces sp. NPDC088116]|uniref:GTPase-associated protein 1-related protein n=1 Tax=Streptomyces sp. NPDC088116 TaxID=3365825 RepID=UPI00380E5F51